MINLKKWWSKLFGPKTPVNTAAAAAPKVVETAKIVEIQTPTPEVQSAPETPVESTKVSRAKPRRKITIDSMRLKQDDGTVIIIPPMEEVINPASSEVFFTPVGEPPVHLAPYEPENYSLPYERSEPPAHVDSGHSHAPANDHYDSGYSHSDAGSSYSSASSHSDSGSSHSSYSSSHSDSGSSSYSDSGSSSSCD